MPCLTRDNVDSWLASLQNHSDLQSNCTTPDELTKT
ncbi:hypothetical protein H5410_043919 [Solanum commersonii]|uniref:Uncharacterized protein n=1 Tax=Solanum commersonii TaxID=4109 RepID=A0A9J5XZQ6_SOLCO|nr:hypothetical protein H5410_043919 [Solanum commersonii]